jgi:hypothetical protein
MKLPKISEIDKELEALYSKLYSSYQKKEKTIPSHFFSDKYMLNEKKGLKVDVYGTSVFHLATLTNQVDQISQKFFTKEYLLSKDKRGKSVMAAIATMDTREDFKRIPRELLTRENITSKSDPPVVCELAGSGNLDLIPPELLTKEVLLTQDRSGNTAIILAARVGKFEQIPQEILTKEILLHKDNYNNTLADHLATMGQLPLLNTKWLTEEILLNDPTTPVMDSVAVHCEDNNSYTQLKLIVKHFDTQLLKKLTESPKYPEKTMNILKTELKRKIKLQALENGLDKKTNTIEL